jgi:hypothetical protein
MMKITHPVAGILATVIIATLWLSTALSELFASWATVVAVKTAIPWGFLVLIPALAVAGGSGFWLAKGAQGSDWREDQAHAVHRRKRRCCSHSFCAVLGVQGERRRVRCQFLYGTGIRTRGRRGEYHTARV